MSRRRLPAAARAIPDDPPAGPETAELPVRAAAAGEAGPPLLMCAIRTAAADGTGPDGAARLAATLVYLGLKMAVMAERGQLARIDEAAAAWHEGRCHRCGVPFAEHPPPDPDDDTGHEWAWQPGRRTLIGQYRRESAALLRGGGMPWLLPGTDPAGIADLYETAAASMTGPSGWYGGRPP